MLTGRQIIALATLNVVPPWNVSSLRGGPFQSQNGEISLREIADHFAAQKATLFVQVRDLGIFSQIGPGTPAQQLARFQTLWAHSAPSKATLLNLSQTLSTAGGSIVYVSDDWQTVGIAGPTAALASVPAAPVPATAAQLEANLNFLQGVALIGGAIVAIGAIGIATGGAGFILIAGLSAADVTFFGATLIGAAGAGYIGISFLQMAAAAPGGSPPAGVSVTDVGLPSPTYGVPPANSGINPADPPTAPVDTPSLPAQPSQPPGSCEVGVPPPPPVCVSVPPPPPVCVSVPPPPPVCVSVPPPPPVCVSVPPPPPVCVSVPPPPPVCVSVPPPPPEG